MKYLESVRDDKQSKCESCGVGWCTLEETYVTVEQAKVYGDLRVKEYKQQKTFLDVCWKQIKKDRILRQKLKDKGLLFL